MSTSQYILILLLRFIKKIYKYVSRRKQMQQRHVHLAFLHSDLDKTEAWKIAKLPFSLAELKHHSRVNILVKLFHINLRTLKKWTLQSYNTFKRRNWEFRSIIPTAWNGWSSDKDHLITKNMRFINTGHVSIKKHVTFHGTLKSLTNIKQ